MRNHPFSLIGNIKIDDIYQKYIGRFYAYLAMSKGQFLKGTICSYKDLMAFSFSTTIADVRVEKRFVRKLVEDGIDVELKTNGVFYE